MRPTEVWTARAPHANDERGATNTRHRDMSERHFVVRELERGNARDRAAFRELNLAWIERWFAVEPRDRYELDEPEEHILDPGGAVFLAELTGDGGPAEIVGACALMRDADSFKLAKMAVAPAARGLGIGRALAHAVIDRARTLGATRVELYSNTVLVPAIALYRSLGFAEAPLPANDFRRANIRMVLPLETSPRGEGAPVERR